MSKWKTIAFSSKNPIKIWTCIIVSLIIMVMLVTTLMDYFYGHHFVYDSDTQRCIGQLKLISIALNEYADKNMGYFPDLVSYNNLGLGASTHYCYLGSGKKLRIDKSSRGKVILIDKIDNHPHSRYFSVLFDDLYGKFNEKIKFEEFLSSIDNNDEVLRERQEERRQLGQAPAIDKR